MRCVAVFALLCVSVAAVGEWTWQAGPSTVPSSVDSAASSDVDGPEGRCCSQSWSTDDALYLFGGATTDFLGDMWRLDLHAPKPVRWTRVVGGGCEHNSGGNSTVPSARNFAVTWTQGDKLFMWGGYGSNYTGDLSGHLIADMWSFDTKQSQAGWTKVSQGPLVPQARNWANFWTAAKGEEVWVHSGVGGSAIGHSGYAIDDLWRFSVATHSWTKVYDYSCTHHSDSDHFHCPANPGVVYDLQGQQEGMRLKPGYRNNAFTATDAEGSLWMYGGEGGITSANGTEIDGGGFQDVWRFSRQTMLWSHVDGPKTVGGKPNYGTKGVASATNLPPAQHAGIIVRQADAGGNMWMFGGENGQEVQGMRNELWSLNFASKEFIWRTGYGFNGTATYGTKGVPSANNSPGARYVGQAWVDTAGEQLWMFGGYGLDANGNPGSLNDTWTYSLKTDDRHEYIV